MQLPDLGLAVKVVSILDSVKDDASDQSVWAQVNKLFFVRKLAEVDGSKGFVGRAAH